jgi:hypothetical protein
LARCITRRIALLRSIKNFFKPPEVTLVFCKGSTVYFKTEGSPQIGKKFNATAKMPEGQSFGAVFFILSWEADYQMFTARVEQPQAANDYLPKLLPLPFEDRRIDPRLDRGVRVLSPQLPGYGAISRNLSENGICLVTTQAYPTGTIISIEMDLDAAGIAPLRLQIETRWTAVDNQKVGHHLVGGRFLALTNTQRGQLRGYIKSLDRQFGEQT